MGLKLNQEKTPMNQLNLGAEPGKTENQSPIKRFSAVPILTTELSHFIPEPLHPFFHPG